MSCGVGNNFFPVVCGKDGVFWQHDDLRDLMKFSLFICGLICGAYQPLIKPVDTLSGMYVKSIEKRKHARMDICNQTHASSTKGGNNDCKQDHAHVR